MEWVEFRIFLLTSASSDRIISLLISNGFVVQKNGASPYSSPNGVSSLLSLFIHHPNKSGEEVSSFIHSMLVKHNIPYYGFHTRPSDKSINGHGLGFLPKIEKKKIFPQGPYRTNGGVISIFQKDDGIIDDSKKQ